MLFNIQTFQSGCDLSVGADTRLASVTYVLLRQIAPQGTCVHTLADTTWSQNALWHKPFKKSRQRPVFSLTTELTTALNIKISNISASQLCKNKEAIVYKPAPLVILLSSVAGLIRKTIGNSSAVMALSHYYIYNILFAGCRYMYVFPSNCLLRDRGRHRRGARVHTQVCDPLLSSHKRNMEDIGEQSLWSLGQIQRKHK